MNALLPILTLVLGASLGALSSVAISRLQHSQRLTDAIVQKYLEARDELCEYLSVLANLSIKHSLTEHDVDIHRASLTTLYYKYYDFMPIEVVGEMLCLFACLSDARHRVFILRGSAIVPMNSVEIAAFIDRIALVDNFRYIAPLALNSGNMAVREPAAVNFQARGVLAAINAHLTVRELRHWTRHAYKVKVRL